MQPLLASEDFELFKTIMHQKNVDVEQPAPQLPPSHNQIPKDLQTARMEKEERMLQEALEQSKREYDHERQKEDQEMERLVKLAKQESLRMFKAVPMEKNTANDQMEHMKMDNELEEEKSENTDEANKSEEEQEGREMPSSTTAKTSSLGLPRDGPLVCGQKQDQPSSIPLGEWSGTGAAELWMQNAKSELNINTSSDTSIPVSL